MRKKVQQLLFAEEAVPKPTPAVFSVLEFIETLNSSLKKHEVRVVGEVSQVKRPASGHVYFTIRDKSGEGVLDCIIWKGNYALCGVDLDVGLQVIVKGHANVYAPTGRLSFIAETIELVGEGALKKAYEALKKKLDGEGLFHPDRKRALPEFPVSIGVITSKEGAVIHDFLNNIGRCGFQISFIDSRVEGQQAVRDLLASVRTFREHDIEALVIIRGGGSLESLQGFNNETLVREIVEFPVPVIVGVGHDKDVPLLALAADAMVSTPTAAAHLLTHSWVEGRNAFSMLQQGLLSRFPYEVKRAEDELTSTGEVVLRLYEDAVHRVAQMIETFSDRIRLNNPKRQLKRGYAIARYHGKALKDASELTKGDEVDVQLHKGAFKSKVI